MISRGLLILGFCAFAISTAFGQTAVVVTEQTMHVKGNRETTLYYGFAQGDTLEIQVRVADGKRLKEVELLQYPASSRFFACDVDSIIATVVAPMTGVYELCLRNMSLFGDRVCTIKIVRTSASLQTADFNTAVQWVVKYDTVSTPVKAKVEVMDTTYVRKTKKVVTKTEYQEDMLVQKDAEEVYGRFNLHHRPNKTLIRVNLPKNVLLDNHTETVDSWVYWIGVGDESVKVWQKNIKAMTNVAKGVLSVVGASPLIGYALGVLSDLAVPVNTDNVKYYFMGTPEDARNFMKDTLFSNFEMGNGSGAYGKVTVKKQGTFYIGLKNDNKMEKINVYIKIAVIWKKEDFATKTYDEMQLIPVKQDKIIEKQKIVKKEVPVLMQRL